VLLANPGWEKRLPRFLEMTGVGRVVNAVEIEESRATWMDGWIPREGRESGAPGAPD
jgi:hypothetical protein